MTDRIQRIYNRVMDDAEHLTISVEKMRLVTESLIANSGRKDIVKRAMAYANYLDNRTIYIEEDQLLAGTLSSKPASIEFKPISMAWPDEDFDNILKNGNFYIDPKDREYVRSLDAFWDKTGQCFTEAETFYYEEDRLWDFRKRGVQAPRYENKNVGFSGYAIGDGWGLAYFNGLYAPDYSMHLYTGFETFIEQAKKTRADLRFFDFESMERYEYLTAMIIAFEAFVRHANRYADLAEKTAHKTSDPIRKQELLQMAQNCRNVPAHGAKTFREGVQALTFYWCQFAIGTIPLGRVDMLLWPLYKNDLENGRITKEEAMELLQCYRLKIADFTFINGKPDQREKWAGKARWNNMIIGGCDRDGNDATNDITYMLLECAKELHLTHPTMTLRVSEKTPKRLMTKALECVRLGMGYPAFISEKEYLDYIVNVGGISIEEARDFCCTGCIDVALPGRSRQPGVPMTVATIMLELAISGGKDELYGTSIGVPCKTLAECDSYEEFYNDSFMKQVEKLISMGIECAVVRQGSWRQHTEDAVMGGFYEGCLEASEDILYRKLKFETSAVLNPVGMVTVIDSLAAIKKICFDDKVATPQQLSDALRANWEGYEDLRKKCRNAPKYGNNEDYVDSIGEKLWNDFRDTARKFTGPFGNPVMLSGVSITTHGPAGKMTGATPDGRYAGEVLSDAAASPAQGRDTNGPLAVLQSAMRMGKGWSTILHNMKFDGTALKTEDDLEKLGDMIKIYLTNGGHQIQLNVVDQATLIDARDNPSRHKNLIVRVAGYSAYFVNLTNEMKTDVINRTLMKSV